MSIRLMTDAWKASIPAGRKMVLLALCDNANDQGECYPSISMLAEKCSMSERSVFSHISDLESGGLIVRKNRAGRSTVYTIDPCKFCTPANSAPLQNLHPTPANSAPPPLQNLHPTPANSAPITINEPSIEPSRNRKRVAAPSKPEDVPEALWADFVTHRKSKKAAITETVLAGFRREAELAGVTLADAIQTCCEANWQGFRADWYAARNAKAGGAVSVPGRGPKPGSDEYAALHKSAGWWREAGFPTIWDAMASKCWHTNAHQFRDGKRAEVAA